MVSLELKISLVGYWRFEDVESVLRFHIGEELLFSQLLQLPTLDNIVDCSQGQGSLVDTRTDIRSDEVVLLADGLDRSQESLPADGG